MREIPFFYGKDVHDAWAERSHTFNPWAGATEYPKGHTAKKSPVGY